MACRLSTPVIDYEQKDEELKAQIPTIRNLTPELSSSLGHNKPPLGCASYRHAPNAGIWLNYSDLAKRPKVITEYVLFHELAHWFFGHMGPIPEIGKYDYYSEDERSAREFGLQLTAALYFPRLELDQGLRHLVPEYSNVSAIYKTE